MMKYITITGDTFDSIARKLYGDEKNAEELINANTDQITTVRFPANVELTIPEISEKSSINNLPPWRL